MTTIFEEVINFLEDNSDYELKVEETGYRGPILHDISNIRFFPKNRHVIGISYTDSVKNALTDFLQDLDRNMEDIKLRVPLEEGAVLVFIPKSKKDE